MKFGTDPVDIIFLRMKIVKTCFKLNDEENQQACGNANT
jgi:hypothetical protein